MDSTRYQPLLTSSLNGINLSNPMGMNEPTFYKALGTACLLIFSFATWPLAYFYTHAHANKVYHDPWIVPIFFIMLAIMLWILAQTFVFRALFLYWMKKPIMERYDSEGRDIQGPI